jgi:two-component system chemotaxis response regulator CheB
VIDVSSVEAVVVGGSAGSFTAIKALLPALPRNLTVPMIIVLHVPGDRPSAMPEILGRNSHVPIKEAEDKETLQAGTVYLAPPGYHVLVEADRSIALSADEPVHFSRPSIDVLFEAAAGVFGERLLAVILTGASADGAAGLKVVAANGGTTVVQRPEDAEQAVMPRAALDAVTPSAVLPLEEIAAVFATLPGGVVGPITASRADGHV